MGDLSYYLTILQKVRIGSQTDSSLSEIGQKRT
jgi:hypothetical protein